MLAVPFVLRGLPVLMPSVPALFHVAALPHWVYTAAMFDCITQAMIVALLQQCNTSIYKMCLVCCIEEGRCQQEWRTQRPFWWSRRLQVMTNLWVLHNFMAALQQMNP